MLRLSSDLDARYVGADPESLLLDVVEIEFDGATIDDCVITLCDGMYCLAAAAEMRLGPGFALERLVFHQLLLNAAKDSFEN
jgi:hypothetical protein